MRDHRESHAPLVGDGLRRNILGGLHSLPCASQSTVRYQDEISEPLSDLMLVRCALGSSCCQSVEAVSG